jgi:hypothetical protein
MLSARHPGKTTESKGDLKRLLNAIETATHETNLLALNMALEGAHAGIGSAAQLADAVGELSIRANQFSRRVRGCVLGRGSKLDSQSLSELHRVTRGVADLIEEVSGLAGEVLDGIADPVVERRLPEVAPDLLDQVRSRAEALDLLLHDIPDAARSYRPRD